ncbi:extensin-like domain-containing protein [Phyllobacterium lublinensis]|uniref:extensin-like domain-containing protein n=1 Tax=Phyllobacterium lublinensis TaxID=2875708 RepID=UPI00351D22C5
MSFALSSAKRLRRISTIVVLGSCTALSACGMGDVRRPMADVGTGTGTMVAEQSLATEENQQVAAEDTQRLIVPEAEQMAAEEVQPLSTPPEEQFDNQDNQLDVPLEPAPVANEDIEDDSYGYAGGISDPIARGESIYAMSGSEVACRTQLKRLGVVFQEHEPINNGGACRIDHPLTVSGFASGRIKLKPNATLNCQMTLAFARWVKGDLSPSTRLRYLSGINTIHQASSYSCRTMSSQPGRSMSEHSKGNALDIAKITLNNGRQIKVQKPGLFAFRQRGLLNSVRSDACDYFTTVLGPGYDRFHRDHFHFDLMHRRSGHRACR